ncbi:MAG TPA: isocitrate lyase/phosphoenolpyruvate mutase family protein [Polyangia bacterium]|jgi:2-methylisocitrate lyase-like PEP mutase family enzyme|nr:isocitrate lyase/phosphoenolpyruvate mutase family protein [Polyangia bacterium]
MKTQAQKAADFAALHAAPGCFVIPNPWDPGSARILAGLGFKALTTTSAGYARSIGVTDYKAGREHVLEHIRLMAPAVDVPLAADLENGFGPRPEDCADTIRLGAEAGLVGGSIEDFTGERSDPIYGLGVAAERVRAAAEAAKRLPYKFMLCARAENYLHGRPDLADTIQRLQAYQEAGADVLFAPGLHTAEEIRTVCKSLDKPVNVMRGPREQLLSVAELAGLGVKRVSLGSLLQAVAMTGLIHAARELATSGTFEFTKAVVAGVEIDGLLNQGAAK